MVTDAELDAGVGEVDGTLATSAALDPSQLPRSGSASSPTSSEDTGAQPGPYAAYGYEAMAVILDSIDRAGDPTRPPVGRSTRSSPPPTATRSSAPTRSTTSGRRRSIG